MKLCPACHTPNAAESNFCKQCGKPLDAPAPVAATVRMTATQVLRGPSQQTFEVSDLFRGKDRLVVGRAPDCDVCLPHPTVSRYHALLERRPDGLWLRDLGSVNGVWLSGARLTEPARVRENDRVGIGPFLLSLARGLLRSVDNSRGLRLEARRLEKVVPLPGGKPRKLLDDINLALEPGEFVCLLGPSGSGKSTLMDCLNGRRRATGGQVLANGEDFYHHFDSFRQSLGYVPQRDIVHTGLTVYRALLYTARLRLPPDTDPAELHARVESVLREMELLPHRDTLVADLSGGQIKRVSLGAELIAEPSLLYIDEATSGLDAGTEARMMRLFRRLADEGRSLICITHTVDHVDQCHLALVLARGKLVFYGPPAEAPRHFGVRRVSEIYDRLAQKDVSEWEQQFTASPLFKQFVLDRLEPAQQQPEPPAVPRIDQPPAPEEGRTLLPLRLSRLVADGRKLISVSQWPPLADSFRQLTARTLRLREIFAPVREGWHQFIVLTARYVELVLGDRRGLRLLLLQAPIVALFLLMGFVNKDFRQPLPIPRPLKDPERKMLRMTQALEQVLDGEAELGPEQKRALKRVRFNVSGVGLPVTVDGTQLVGLLRRLERQELTAEQRQALEEARFTFEPGGEPVTVTGAELVAAWGQFRESHIPGKLLAAGVLPDRQGLNPRYTYIMLFIVAMIVLWFGCNNAAKEIVKEEAIYSRERAVNLHVLPYLASKFLVLSVITAVHALTLIVILYGTLELLHATVPGHSVPPAQHMLGYPAQFGVLVLLAMTGVALGLLLSACVSTPDRANALLPYVLIPQIILGGGILSVHHGLLHYVAVTLSPVYWAYRALHLGAASLPPGFPGHAPYEDGVRLPCQALLVQMAVLLLLTAWFLRRKDAR